MNCFTTSFTASSRFTRKSPVMSRASMLLDEIQRQHDVDPLGEDLAPDPCTGRARARTMQAAARHLRMSGEAERRILPAGNASGAR